MRANLKNMLRLERPNWALSKQIAIAYLAVAALSSAVQASAQNTPLISGGVGFVTSTNNGNTTYTPVISPVLAAPLGDHLLVESRATILDSWFPNGSHGGYTSNSFLGLSYLQADIIASSQLTFVAGEFLTPFGTYNERLTPIWISSYEDAPLIYPLGIGTGSGVGGMLRGSLFSSSRASIDYATYFSATSTNEQFNAQRSSGGRLSVYFPDARLEAGISYSRRLQGAAADFVGTHLWWEPAETHFRLRSEYAHGPHAQGYWAQADYRLARFGGEDSFLGRFEPVFRIQQTFRNSPDASDGLPATNTQRADFGINYRLTHELRINSSYSRQFSDAGNRNIWETGIVYRFLFPTWKGK